MANEDLFRRSFEAGIAFLDMTRERAESFVKDLVKAGEVSKGKAQKLADDLVDRGRRGTEELREMIRRELVELVEAMGLATKEDVSRLEQRIDAMSTSASAAGAGGDPRAPKSTKSPGLKRSAASRPPKAAAKAAAKAATKAPRPRKAPRPHKAASTGPAPGSGDLSTPQPPAEGALWPSPPSSQPSPSAPPSPSPSPPSSGSSAAGPPTGGPPANGPAGE
jgi:polyhydroxyalkanoate synthesis regulator phasin